MMEQYKGRYKQDLVSDGEREFNFLSPKKGDEHYAYVFDDAALAATIDTFRKHASDKMLALNWFDCVVLTDKAKTQIDMTTPKS